MAPPTVDPLADDARSPRTRVGARTPLAVLLLLLALSACARGYSGAGYATRGDPWFDTDVLSGIGEGGRPRATVTVSIPRRNLVFFQRPHGYAAGYRVRAIQRVDGRAMRMQEWSGEAHAESFEDTRKPDVERRTVSVDLLEGASDSEHFQLEVQVAIEGTKRIASRVVEIEPRRYEMGGIALGEPALYRQRAHVDRPDPSMFELGAALPDSRDFVRQENGNFDLATGAPWLLVRIFDLRAAPAAEPYAITVRTLPGSGSDPRWTETFAAPSAGDETAVLIRVPPQAFAFGDNRLRIAIPGAESVEIELANLGLDFADQKSWNANLEQIEVLGDRDEMRRLREAPADERLGRWEEFWQRRDPDDSTPENERLEEHYRRVAHARAFLQDGFSDGALSDRGRIWILHGRPDLVENSAPGFQSYATYEIWTYRDLGLVYYFQDSDAFGSYRLVWREVT